MKNVLIRMNQYRAQASGAERGVLDWVLENPEAASQCSIHRLAEQSYTSPSTVVRICRKLGFEGYRDLQKSLLCELAIRQENKADPSGQLEYTDQLTDIIDKVTYRNIASLENSRMLIEPEVIRRSVDLICASSTVLLFGMGASFLVAQDAYQKFIRVGKRCALSEDIHCQYVHARKKVSSMATTYRLQSDIWDRGEGSNRVMATMGVPCRRRSRAQRRISSV